ncbi:MAG: transglycosylase SLT domain-containing protein [Polyangiales bacterium]
MMRTRETMAALLILGACASTSSDTKSTLLATHNTAAQNRGIARELIQTEHASWDDGHQFQCLDKLWQAESHWNHRARNKRTGACGIPQAYPCNKMSDWGKVYGVDYRANPWPQIAWGLQYIEKRYRTPCAAWNHFQHGGGY